MTVQTHYVLVVRFPTGGIRTHLKYALGAAGESLVRLKPVLVCPDDEEGRALAQVLSIPPDMFLPVQGHRLSDLASMVFAATRRFRARVIHSHGFTSALSAFPATLLLRRRHIVTVHDVVTAGLVAHKGPLAMGALGCVLRNAYAVHAVGEDCAASLRDVPFMRHATNIAVIPNGINSAQFSNVIPDDVRARFGIAQHTVVIGFFGRFMSPKGFRILVDAVRVLAKRHDSKKFVVVAVGGGGFVREDKAYVVDAGLSNRFHFLSFVENPAALMAAMDVVVMPSRWEAYGLVAAEVMAVGVPLIASDCVGLREVVHDTPARSFPSGDTDALAQQIEEEMARPSTAEARAFAPFARARFDVSKSAVAIRELLAAAAK